MSSRTFLFYLPKNSPFHHLNSLTKLALVLFVSFIALMVKDFELNFWIMVAAFILLLLTRVPIKHLKTPLVSIFFMMITLTLMYSLLSKIPGEHVYYVFPWGTYFTENTLINAFTIIFRVMSMVFITLVLFATTKDSDIIKGLSAIKVPYVICFTLSLSIRSISMFAEDWHTILEAYRSKGMNLSKGSIIQKLKNYVGALIPLVVITLNKVKDIDFAAESRGFRLTGKGRTHFDVLEWHLADFFVFLVTISVFVYFLLVYYLGITVLNIPFFGVITLPRIPYVFPILWEWFLRILQMILSLF